MDSVTVGASFIPGIELRFLTKNTRARELVVVLRQKQCRRREAPSPPIVRAGHDVSASSFSQAVRHMSSRLQLTSPVPASQRSRKIPRDSLVRSALSVPSLTV